MIPDNRPVLGKDLDTIKQEFGMLTADACWLFGLPITKWMNIVRKEPDKPISDPTLALLIRFLDQHPELNLIPKFPEASEMFEMVKGIQDVDQKRFSLMFGSESSAAYRWLREDAPRMSPSVGRLMYYVRMALLAAAPSKRADLLEQWRRTVLQEGRARGVEDVFKACTWTTDEQKRQARERRATAKAPAPPAKKQARKAA